MHRALRAHVIPGQSFSPTQGNILLPRCGAAPRQIQTLKDSLELLADYLHGFALAMHCNPEHKRFTVDSMDGPIRIYIRAIASVAPR